MRNVVLLTIDALRRDALGCYGGGSLTPFVDSIQHRCIRFDLAHSPGPYTRAAFPGILTSSYYLEHGKETKLWKTRVLVSEVLKRGGVVTVAFHSNPYLTDTMGWNRGWNVFYDSMEDEVDDKVPYIEAEKINRKVNAWVSSYAAAQREKRFFLWVHYMDVHEPYVPKRSYIDRVDPSIRLTDDEMYRLFKEIILGRNASDPSTVNLLKKLYSAHVRAVDDATQELFEILEKWDVLKESRVIITTDHGDEFGEHGGLSHDGKMYSELVHVPLLIYEPTRQRGEICEKLVTTLDVAPTILTLFGLDSPPSFQGHSLLPIETYPVKGVYGEAVDKHGSQEKGEEKEVHYYREGDLKIIYHERGNVWELYDLKADPGELNNLIESSPQAESMKAKIKPRVRRYERR